MEDEKEVAEVTVQKESTVKFLSGMLPMITVIILATGIIKQYLYYLNFNLPIKYFISLSEIGLNISDNLVIITPLLIVYYFIYTWYLSWIKQYHKKEYEKPESNHSHKVNKERSWIIIIALIFFLVCLFLFFWVDSFIKKLNISSLLISSGSLVIILYFIESTWKYFKNDNQFIYFIVFISFLNVFVLLTAKELTSVEKGRYTGTIITTNDSTKYESNDTSYFIGKTEKYFFIYNKNRKSTSIIPSDQVIKMELFSK